MFAVKASRYLTHMKKLNDPEEPLHRLLSHAGGLEEEDGPFRVGAKVDVKGFAQPDGSIMATDIETDE